MLVSSLIADQNHAYDDISDLGSDDIKGTKTNHQTTFSLSLPISRASPSFIPQPDFSPHRTTTEASTNTLLQSVIQPNQSDLNNLNLFSSNMNVPKWSPIDDDSNLFSTSESLIAQAIPASLAAPKGWHSEVVESSSSISNDIGTNVINRTKSSIQNHGEYKTLSTHDAPPMIFCSNDEANRIVNEISSSNLFPSTNISSMTSESSNKLARSTSTQEQKVFSTRDQQSSIINVEHQEQLPIVVHKKSSNNDVTYQQKISVRYLQPPTPPPPAPIIIREVHPPPPRPQSPVQIRQRAPPPCTPPPLIIRDRPPPRPPRPSSQIIEKLLPPPPRPPRRMIVERYAQCPPKPPDVVIERWLPYRRSDQRRIFYERAPAPYMPPREPNLLIEHDQPHARVHKEFINQGVSRADPAYYLQQYGAEIDSPYINSQYGYLVGEAARALPPPQPLLPTNAHHDYHPSSSPFISSMWDRMRSASPPTPLVSSMWDKMRSASPPPPLVSSIWDKMKFASPLPYPTPYPHNYPAQSPYNDHLSSYHSYDNYSTYRQDVNPMVNTTPLWSQNFHSSPSQSYLPSHQLSSSSPPSPYPVKTIQVNSDAEFQRVLSDLTNHNIPRPLRS